MQENYSRLKDSSHTFIIAEAGSNWKCGTYEEDLEQAKKLIKTAAKAGADAVKFQTYRPETIYVPDAGKSDYLSKHGISQDINDIFEHLSMPYEMIPELAKICKQENIMFM
jgi:N,N'-diacetyllegionaminate synthase